MTTLALVLLAVAAVGFLARAMIGPSLADRVVAVDHFVQSSDGHPQLSQELWVKPELPCCDPTVE